MKKGQYLLSEDDIYNELYNSSKPITLKTERKPKSKVIDKSKESKPFIEINPIYRYNKDGEFVDKYLNGKQLAKKFGYREYFVNKAADQEKTYNGFFLSRVSYTKEQLLERLRPKEKGKEKKINKEKKLIKNKVVKKSKPIKEKKIIKTKVVKKSKPIKEKKPYIQYHRIYQYNSDGELVATYDNGGDMAKKTGWNHNTVKSWSTLERVYKGFLLTRVIYDPQQAKQRFTEALKGQQMTYIYKGSELVEVFSSLKEVKAYLGTELNLRQISYYKEKQKPIGEYLLLGKYKNWDNQ